ncbi:MAG TPA: FecR family protein [Methylomirabilota bacterium]|nr:FecR family protein [Methylomirabilota bacterium]
MIQLAAEEAWAGARKEAVAGWWERLWGWCHTPVRPGKKLVFAVSLVLVLVASAWFSRPFHPGGFKFWRRDSICTVYDALDVRWAAGSRQPKVGDVVRAGPLRLESGVIELEFPREEKIAVEGPAELDLTSPRSVLLQHGKLAAYVPASGRGFEVTTPSARVVDFGTQFGVSATAGVTEVGVFEGRVQVMADTTGASRQLTPNMAVAVDRAGMMSPIVLFAGAFPQVGRAIQIDPGNCGFDEFDRMRGGGMPAAFGFWSGPACTVSGPMQGIIPFKGAGMLRFLASPSSAPVWSAAPAKAEVWQLVDLRAYKEMLVEGGNGKLSAMFNRIGGAQVADTFGLTLAAFQGRPEDAAALWPRRSVMSLALMVEEITTDDDPATWEKLEISASLPAETDFLIIELRATGPTAGAGTRAAFPGHFADHVVFKLRVPLLGSSASTSR